MNRLNHDELEQYEALLNSETVDIFAWITEKSPIPPVCLCCSADRVGDGLAHRERDPALGEEQALWRCQSRGIRQEQEVLFQLSRFHCLWVMQQTTMTVQHYSSLAPPSTLNRVNVRTRIKGYFH